MVRPTGPEEKRRIPTVSKDGLYWVFSSLFSTTFYFLYIYNDNSLPCEHTSRQLFHIMSVGLVVWNSNQDTSRVASGEKKTPPGLPPEHVRIPPAEMADVLRNYIEQFFPCEVCQLHFLTTYDACALDRCTRLDTHTDHDTEIAALERYIQYPLWYEKKKKQREFDSHATYIFISCVHVSLLRFVFDFVRDCTFSILQVV